MAYIVIYSSKLNNIYKIRKISLGMYIIIPEILPL